MMTNIDKITARIQADAQAQIDALNQQTDLELQELGERYARLAEAAYVQTLEQGKADAEAQLQRLDSMDALEARKQLLAQKQALIAETFQGVMDYLTAMDDAQRATFLAQLAVNACQTGEEELVLSTHDREAIGEGVIDAANMLLEQTGRTGKLTLSNDTRSSQGGLYIRNGSVETNCSYETILRLAQETYAAEVAGLLFQ